MPDAITSFTGAYRWLSNFAECSVKFQGEVYRTVEHAYQAAKSEDPLYREIVRNCKTPGEAKRFGRVAPISEGWAERKENVMLELTRKKYQHEYYRQLLIATGSLNIVEGNNWGDNFWGVCNGEGLNKLGLIIMTVRDEINKRG